MEIMKNFLTPNKYSRPQSELNEVTKIAIHYVGNPGSTALANRNYFESLKDGENGIYASSHYIIGLQGEIIQCVPENEIAYCTNQANSYSISIENCHPTTDGKFNNTTTASLVELCADICIRYGLNPLTDMIRHYDVTSKICPKYYVDNPTEWEQLKVNVQMKINELNDDGNEVNEPDAPLTPVIALVEKQIDSMIADYILGGDLKSGELNYDFVPTSPIVAYNFGTPPDLFYVQGVPCVLDGTKVDLIKENMVMYATLTDSREMYNITVGVNVSGSYTYYRAYVNGNTVGASISNNTPGRTAVAMGIILCGSDGASNGGSAYLDSYINDTGFSGGLFRQITSSSSSTQTVGFALFVFWNDGSYSRSYSGNVGTYYNPGVPMTASEIEYALGATHKTAGHVYVESNWS